ncbi:hypothetical protein BD414DRAFT_518205 [Trametes punicea]|nr:hypothetical protein BD414DRAFT_518205 [Trametes punicea]
MQGSLPCPRRDLFFPLPGTYAVVELDIENTLKALDDPVAYTAGVRIKTTKCIVYFTSILQLPFPTSRTLKYTTYLIDPGLRPAVPEECITSEMCIPIFPNSRYPFEDRAPLRTKPTFSFNNCYHWLGTDMELDLRILNHGRDYEDPATTELPSAEHVRIEFILVKDVGRSVMAYRAIHALPASSSPIPASPTPDDLEEDSEGAERTAHSVHPSSTDSGADGRCKEYEWDSMYDSEEVRSLCSSKYQQSDRSDGSVEALAGMGIFGLGWDDREDLFPLVKIWLDLGAHFKGEDIPNPLDCVQQYNELVDRETLPGLTMLLESLEVQVNTHLRRILPDHKGLTNERDRLLLGKVVDACCGLLRMSR